MDAPVPPTGERILAVIGNLTRASGFMGRKQTRYSLVLTDHRVIFAELTEENVSALVKQAQTDAKAEGKGLLDQLGARFAASSNYHEKYWQTAPDATLAESAGNFAIDRTTIKRVKFRTGVVDDEYTTSDQVTIETTSEKYKLQVGGLLSDAKEAFREAGIP